MLGKGSSGSMSKVDPASLCRQHADSSGDHQGGGRMGLEDGDHRQSRLGYLTFLRQLHRSWTTISSSLMPRVLRLSASQVTPTSTSSLVPTTSNPTPIPTSTPTPPLLRLYGFLRGTLRAPAVGWMMYNMLVSNEKAIQSQYKSHVYADPDNVTPNIIESRYALTKRKGARYVPAAFLTGLLDPVQSREEFLALFAELEGKLPIMVVSTSSSPKRSKAEMDALKGAKGVSKFVEVSGALLPQEEYPLTVAEELYKFLQENFESEN